MANYMFMSNEDPALEDKVFEPEPLIHTGDWGHFLIPRKG